MKKLLTIILALVMSLSIATVFTACEDEVTPQSPAHTHTYSSEWTNDDTHHWHKATCEHTEEISDKAEHTYGEDGKCTVCQKEKPATSDDSAYKVTAEQWTAKLSALSNMTNVRIVDLATMENGYEFLTLIEIDGDKIAFSMYSNDSFVYANVIAKVGEGVYDVYEKTAEDGQYVKLQDPEGIEEAVLNANDYIYQYANATNFAKDKFDNAAYSVANKNYTLEVPSVEKPNYYINIANFQLIVAFENGEVKDLSIDYVGVWGQGADVNYSFDFEFGGVSIEVPSILYTVTQEQWEQNFTEENLLNAKAVVENFQNGNDSIVERDGDTYKYLTIYADESENVGIITKQGEIYTFYRLDEYGSGLYEQLSIQVGQYEDIKNQSFAAFDILLALKTVFSSDNYSEQDNAYKLYFASMPYGQEMTLTEVYATVIFENGVLKSVTGSFYKPDQTQCTFEYTIGTANIVIPTGEMLMPQN